MVFGLTNSAQFVNNIIVNKNELNRVTPFNDQENLGINFFNAESYDYNKSVDENFNFSLQKSFLQTPLNKSFSTKAGFDRNITDGLMGIETYNLQLKFDSILLNDDGTDFKQSYKCYVNNKEYEMTKLASGSATLVNFGVIVPIEINNTYKIKVKSSNTYFASPFVNEIVTISRDFIDNHKSMIYYESGSIFNYYVLNYMTTVTNPDGRFDK